jgi:hypothetical protein
MTDRHGVVAAFTWLPGRLHLFITHTHEHRGIAKQIKEALTSPYRVDGFVAHDDIEPTRLWEDEITSALRTCDALLALLTPGFHESKWCDQEVGWVLGRERPLVASVNMGATPHGFIGRFQAIPRFGDDPAQIAEALHRALLDHPSTAEAARDALVYGLEYSTSWEMSKQTFQVLQTRRDFTGSQLERIRAAYRNNPEVSDSFYVQNNIRAFMHARGGPDP